MELKFKNKKGDNIITPQLIIIIVAIASFVVILAFIFLLNPKGAVNKQVCHNSVVMKATTKGTIDTINCKTDYVCISNGGTCSDILPTQTIKITGAVTGTGSATYGTTVTPAVSKAEQIEKNQTFKAIANLMADCWWMFGEGQLDYSEKSFATVCAICSVVKFDDKLQADFPSGLHYRDLLEYLRDTKITNSQQSYLNYLFGDNSVDYLLGRLDEKRISETISLKEKYIIRTGQTNTGFGGFTIPFLFGEGGIYHLFPYLLDISNLPNEPTCSDFITKS